MKQELSKRASFFSQLVDGHCLFPFNPPAKQKENPMQKPSHLNQILKNHALSFLSDKAESFSQSLRELMVPGQPSSPSLGLPNEGIERSLRGIAQKHDLGEQLSDDEITYLLGCVE